MHTETFKKFPPILFLALFSFLFPQGGALGMEGETGVSPEVRKAGPVTEQLTRQGVVVDFTARPSPGRSMTGEEIYAGDFLDVSFRISDAASGLLLQGQFPGAWMDISRNWEGDQTINTTCKDRVGLYLQGLVGVRPLIDLNSYFILVMNRDPSIAVIDPITGVSGITKLYAQINLKSPGADWTKTRDEKRLFVTMPLAGEMAVVDTDTFQVTGNVQAGNNPMRIALQPDGKYLWVGNDSEEEGIGGVTAIETETLRVTATIATGKGHHEITFSGNTRYAFVSNREEGTVSVVDIQKLEKVKDIPTGPLPISLAYSSLSRTLYVADGEKGEVTVIDGDSLEVVTRIATGPGLGPVGFSQDGRWGVVVNSREDIVYIIDPSTNRIAHTLAVGKQPYQMAFSRSFAYVRSLGTERVSMIDLSELGKEETVPVVTFAAGQRAPQQAKEVSMAQAIVEAPGEAAVLVVSPADTTVYYYMEGMNAPMGNFRNYGHMPRAVQVADRSMQEREPGVYSATVRIPDSGTYEVAFLLDSPSILHCFQVSARPNPLLEVKGAAIKVDYLNQKRRVEVGERVQLRFRLTDRKTRQPRTDLKDVSILYFLAPGGKRTRVAARHSGEGIYEAALTLAESGAYYIYVVSPSEQVKPNDLPFMTLRAGGRPARR